MKKVFIVLLILVLIAGCRSRVRDDSFSPGDFEMGRDEHFVNIMLAKRGTEVN